MGWHEPRLGRESLAGELFTATLSFYQGKVDDGTIESFEPVILSRHGGDLNGFFFIKGNVDKLDALKQSSEFKDLTMKAIYCLDGYGLIDGFVGEGLQDIMQHWMKSIA